jgi:hypothetical protein
MEAQKIRFGHLPEARALIRRDIFLNPLRQEGGRLLTSLERAHNIGDYLPERRAMLEPERIRFA